MLTTTNSTKQAAHFLKAIGNYYRLQIVQLLINGEKNVSALNEKVKVSQPALSQHLAKLRHAGIVGSRREQRQIFYFISNPRVIRHLGLLREQFDLPVHSGAKMATKPTKKKKAA